LGLGQVSLSSTFSEPIDVLEVEMNPSSVTSNDVTPKLILSPCFDESPVATPPLVDPRVAQLENQRQLLDVSPTGEYEW